MAEFERFKVIARGLRKAVVDFPLNGDSEVKVDEHWSDRLVKDVASFEECNAVSSEHLYPYEGMHALLLDLDVAHVYVPSSTPYHSHLIIDVNLKQHQMQEVLDVLGKYNILQVGYVSAARFRKAAWLRAPWSKKLSGE